jgi:hypothetical protein
MDSQPALPPNPQNSALYISQRHYQARQLMLDYAVGAAILGLNPFDHLLTPVLLITAGLTVKMMRDIGAVWEFARGQDMLAIAGNLFGGLGAFAMALMAWVTMVALSALVPILSRFAISAALFTVVWMLGVATNQFYFNGYENQLQVEALREQG